MPNGMVQGRFGAVRSVLLWRGYAGEAGYGLARCVQEWRVAVCSVWVRQARHGKFSLGKLARGMLRQGGSGYGWARQAR